jgi:hypothetical protein
MIGFEPICKSPKLIFLAHSACVEINLLRIDYFQSKSATQTGFIIEKQNTKTCCAARSLPLA